MLFICEKNDTTLDNVWLITIQVNKSINTTKYMKNRACEGFPVMDTFIFSMRFTLPELTGNLK